MIRKSVFTGTITGLLLTLTMILPVFAILLGRALPGMGRPVEDLFGEFLLPGVARVSISLLVMMALGGVAMLVLFSIGSVAALRSGANSWHMGLKAGMTSGLFAALVIYIFLIAPTSMVVHGASMLAFPLSHTQRLFPPDMAVPFARFALFGELRYLAFTLLAGVVVGGLEGMLVGILRRNHPLPPGPASLLDCMDMRSGHRTWFKNHEQPTLMGLLTGLAGGIILIIQDLWNRSVTVTLDPNDQWMAEILRQALQGAPAGEFRIVLVPLLLTLSFLVVIGGGGLAAFLPKNPPGFLRSRVLAATVAGVMVGLLISLPTAAYMRFSIILLPQFLLSDLVAIDPVEWQALNAISSQELRVLLVYLAPLPVIGVITLGLAIVGMLQGFVYTLVFSFFKLRPVDRARVMRKEIKDRPDHFLPQVYALFQADREAVLLLEHLAFDLRSDPPKARVVAAFHTLATRPALAPRAFEQIAGTLETQETWKLRGEILALHNILTQGMKARTLAQIAQIAPVPEDQTTSLLPSLAKAGDFLSRPLVEIKKVERVDDLNSKIIFLSNALENLRQARIFCETTAVEHFATPLPEVAVLRVLLDQWEGIILSAVREIQGRAEVDAHLKVNKLTFAKELPVTVVLENHGLNVAERVRLIVDAYSDQYEVVEGAEQVIAILAPQESREVTLLVRPRRLNCEGKNRGNADCMRVCWAVRYGDALKPDHLLEFADQVEFIEVEKPFQRIFPIPYVTGTPLQSEQMFVGRRDVFAFVREHLFGTYQNNVIVLHGQRRTGKSSILYRLGSEMKETHVCVLIDMQGKAARGEVDFLYSIADDIVYALENQGIVVDLPRRKEFEESPEFFFRSRFLRGIYDALGEKNLLLMFDEFEELQKRVEDGKLSADIFPYLRNLMQHERRLDFIFAGTHKLEDLAAEYWSILFNIAIYKRITFLEPEEVTHLVNQPVLDYGLEYDPLAVERIYQVASGHPYFTQVVCHELVAYHNETRRSYLTVTDVEAALGRILERGEAHFKYIWAESTTEQRLALLALAELLETDEAATLEDICDILERRGRPIIPEGLLEALANLEARDILMRSGPRSNLYRFRVDLIRRWLYAARPSYEKVL